MNLRLMKLVRWNNNVAISANEVEVAQDYNTVTEYELYSLPGLEGDC